MYTNFETLKNPYESLVITTEYFNDESFMYFLHF